MKRRTHPKPVALAYQERIIVAFQRLNLAPGLHAIRVAHDDDCPLAQGRTGGCCCVPDISIDGLPDGAVVIDVQGIPHRRANLS